MSDNRYTPTEDGHSFQPPVATPPTATLSELLDELEKANRVIGLDRKTHKRQTAARAAVEEYVERLQIDPLGEAAMKAIDENTRLRSDVERLTDERDRALMASRDNIDWFNQTNERRKELEAGVERLQALLTAETQTRVAVQRESLNIEVALATAQADAARLDWMQEQGDKLATENYPRSWNVDDDGAVYSYSPLEETALTLREALDFARAARIANDKEKGR